MINLNSLGKDSEKGGVFFNSSLLPSGLFSNIPNTYGYTPPTTEQEATLVLTLEKIKDSLKEQLKLENNANASDSLIEKFLYEFTSLLVDYRDMRNYIFYGSANTELAYNIKKLIGIFPYKFWISTATKFLHVIPEIKAIGSITIALGTIGDVIEIKINEPTTGLISLGVYTQDSSDTTADILAGHIESVLATNTYGYTVSVATNIITIVAKAGLGASINGGTRISSSIPETITQFSGGSDLVTPTTDDAIIEIENDVVNNTTSLIFSENAIKDGIEQFSLFDTSIDFNWNDYEVVDTNANRYKIIEVISPYIDTRDSTSSVFSVINVSIGNNGFNTMEITTDVVNNYQVGEVISILNIKGDESLNGEYVISDIVSSTSFLVVSKYRANDMAMGYVPQAVDAIFVDPSFTFVTNEDTLVRRYPPNFNPPPYMIKINVKGNFFENYLSTFTDGVEPISGFVISPTQTILADFEYNLTEIQKILLSPAPLNQTPWPRRPITNNIQMLLDASNWNSVEQEFVNWIQDPNFLFIASITDDDDTSYSDTYTEYRLIRALGLDETTTNQLIRRCIPQDMISEIYDPNYDFQRFILIAGWFFDQIKLYIDFLKYTHHLNTSNFNQLSPEYYRYYASHFGLDLFTDDGIDFSKLVIKTEPGLYFRQQGAEEKDTKFYQLTLQQLQYERQKRLLLSLFYLYKTKGTQGTINKLVSLLGAPDGFFLLTEYAFEIKSTDTFGIFDVNNMVGKRVVNNEKVNVPTFGFEIDPSYPTTDTIPPVYRMKLDNENVYNLRQIGVQTNPNGAIDSQVINIFGEQKSYYGKFNDGEFANLQDLNSDYSIANPYYFLPLTIPDKFSGISVEYMIPQNGFKKGLSNNNEESNIHLCSLFEINKFNETETSVAYLYPFPEVTANNSLTSKKQSISDVVADNGQYDSNILKKYLKINNYNADSNFIICRIEGLDLVIRMKITKESTNVSSDTYELGERVAILENVFSADGLNHTLRMIFRPEGVEVYQDYSHLGVLNNEKIGIALWRNPYKSNLAPSQFFTVLEIPKILISNCTTQVVNPTLFVALPDNENLDVINNWDLFIGLPTNLDLYFKKITIFENYAIDSFDESDRLFTTKNYTAEYWSFSFLDNSENDKFFKIKCEFSQMEPNINNADYSYKLPIEGFNDKIVVKDLSLSSKQILNQDLTTKYFYKKQNFFEIQDLFGQNAWQSDIHTSYTYNNFSGKVIDLYRIYSEQVLTYDSLAPFLDLIENKFRPLIEDFIPIVINISEFGRLIINSMFIQQKTYYKNVFKKCIGKYMGVNSILQFKLSDIIAEEVSFEFEILNGDATSFIPPIPVTWNTNFSQTEYDLITALRAPSTNVYGNNLKIYYSDGIFSITVDAKWYQDNFNQSANDLNFVISVAFEDYYLPTNLPFAYGQSNQTNNSCLMVEYKLPLLKSDDVWVYLEEEKQPDLYIFNSDESTTDETYLK